MREFKGVIYVDFREYYIKQEGGSGPTKKGTSLNIDLWEKFLGIIDDINSAIANKQAGLPAKKPELSPEQNGNTGGQQ